ncbi:ExbD/TolR family protein [Pelagicoccus albus]|uniref:Biopolymer transporter ExbD n=1 Tax=Pelagicoccus albus TaxID=415222 RepID=A0A7X1B936_9BACT|nr:biopolymer transporter ExbD [Pelagicoccus albus]MBC2607960.1 biopolymer transporter ExbD [Pelagicoccus albus]
MRNRPSLDDSDNQTDELNISPLIDMVFILLIFFIVTTVFVEETGVDVNKPQAASAVDLEKNSILIAITDTGKVVYGGREIGLSGVRSIVRRNTQREMMPVIIQADRNVPTHLLVGVIDESKLAGAESVSISTEN